jgi:hypothetical protein
MLRETGTVSSSSASLGGSEPILTKPVAILFLASIFLGLLGTPLGAQDEGPVQFRINPETGEATVTVGKLIHDPPLLEAIHSGLPLRIRIQTHLWEDGFFDDELGRHEWRATVIFDPLTRRYLIQSGRGGAEVRGVNTLEEAEAVLQQTLEIPLRPGKEGKFYYLADVEMETLSLSDLEELERWLQGELGPAVSGDEDVGGALAKGFKRVLVRMLGLPARKFQLKSPSFEIRHEDPGTLP